jgi:hypothetical protein
MAICVRKGFACFQLLLVLINRFCYDCADYKKIDNIYGEKAEETKKNEPDQ